MSPASAATGDADIRASVSEESKGNPRLWETPVLGARMVLNIVPEVTGKRKYSAKSKTASATSELFLPTSLFQSFLLLGVPWEIALIFHQFHH